MPVCVRISVHVCFPVVKVRSLCPDTFLSHQWQLSHTQDGRRKEEKTYHTVLCCTHHKHTGMYTHILTQFHIYQQPHEMSYSDETLRRLKMLNSHLIKRIHTFVPSREGKARFDKSDMWVDRERWELNLSLQEKKQLLREMEPQRRV